MPRRKRSPTPNYETYDEDFDEDSNSNSLRLNQDPPIQRNAANARERARMRVLSSAFCRLKTKLPNIPPDTKLSKLDTLRLATIYIQQLKSLLDGETIDSDTVSSPSSISLHSVNSQNLTWPFTFQQMNTNLRHNTNNNNNNNNNISNNNSNNNYHHRPQHYHHHHLYHHPATNNCLDGWITAPPTTLLSSAASPKFSNKFCSINNDNNNSSNIIN